MLFRGLKPFALNLALCLVSLSLPGYAQGEDELKQGVTLFNQKKFEVAMPLFTRAAQKGNIRGTYYLALCHQNLRHEEKARELFRHISKNWAGSEEASLSDAYLARAGESVGSSASSTSVSTGGASGIAAGVSVKDRSSTPGVNLGKGNAPVSGASGKLQSILSAADAKSDEITAAQWTALPQTARIPFQMKDGHMWVQTKVNGNYINVVFDTGASVCVLSTADFPNLFSQAELERGKAVMVARPHGNEQMRMIDTEISMHNITRKCTVAITHSPGISVIGQNFFKEYSYEIDGFYLRLTKAPLTKQQPVAVQVTEKGNVVGVLTRSVSAANAAKTHDKYSLPFVRQMDVMLVDIEVNGHKTQACFDTGCAPDGIVVPPRMRSTLGLQQNSDGVYAENVVIGPISRKFVPAYPASNLPCLLIGPKLFGDRRYTIDPVNNLIKFQY